MAPVSLVLLVHNEASIIESVIRDFDTKIISLIPGSEIVIAEDGSTDGTKEILRRLVKENPRLRLEEGTEKRGYVNAFKKAMTLPQNEVVIYCDSSGKYDPNDFWRMIPLMKDHDMVMGYKASRKDPLYRVMIAKVFNFLINIYFGLPFHDIDCPFRVFKKSIFLKICEGEIFHKELINFEVTVRMVKYGYKVAEIPIAHFARKNGASRGLPLKKLPSVIFRTLRYFPQIKADIKDKKSFFLSTAFQQ